jgi:cytochrome c-type biogenesis protein CcmH
MMISKQKILSALFALLLALTCGFPTFARSAALSDETVEKRLLEISSELRCLVCQNESLSSSGADLAADLRERIRVMILEGRTDDEIRDFMTERYGDFILYRPRLKSDTFLLWFGPAFLVIGALGAFILQLKRRARPASTHALGASDRARAETLLSTDIFDSPSDSP